MKKTVIKEDTKINPEFESKCENCFWHLGEKRCAAFDGDIPDKIWNGSHDTILPEQTVRIKFESKGEAL